MSKRHLELKISYLRYRLSIMPHGFFGNVKGRDLVYVFYDPNDDRVSRCNKRRYFCSSKRGEKVSEQIKEYVELKGQLDLLLKEWKTQYQGEQRLIVFPLLKRRIGPLDHDFFVKAKPNQVEHPDGKFIDHKGQELLSKNEEIVAQVIEKMGYEFKAGVFLDLDKFTHLHPDILFYVPEIDKVFLIEIDGALDSISYVSKSYHNTAACILNGFTEMKDFVVIRIGHGYEINSEQIEGMLWATIDLAIDDIVIC